MSWLSQFAGSGGLGILPSLLFDGNKSQGGSQRDNAPQPASGLPSYNTNMNAPQNFWQGNQLQIPGAQGLGGPPPVNPQQQQQSPMGGLNFGGFNGPMQAFLGKMQGALGGQGGGMGGLAGLLGGGGGQMPGSGSSTLPSQGQGGGMAQALNGMQGNPGIMRLLQMVQQQR